MPRKYTPKEGARKRVAYDPETVKNAVKAVEDGYGYRGTAKKFAINVMTLKRICRKQKHMQPGYKSRLIFTESQESELGQYLTEMSNMYYGLTIEKLRILAYRYAKMNTIKYPSAWDTAHKAGIDWYRGFLERNRSLSLGTLQATNMTRATACNRHAVKEFFENLTEFYETEGIWNTGKTGLTTVHKPTPISAVKSSKQVGNVISGERGELVTVCACANSAGRQLPPFMIFPRKNWQERFLNHAPHSSSDATTQTDSNECPSLKLWAREGLESSGDDESDRAFFESIKTEAEEFVVVNYT